MTDGSTRHTTALAVFLVSFAALLAIALLTPPPARAIASLFLAIILFLGLATTISDALDGRLHQER